MAADWEIYPEVFLLGGDTTYDIKALAEYPAVPGELSEIRSELEFPLSTTMMGLTLGWNQGSGPWGIRTGAAVSLSDPSDPMVDRDWVGDVPVSYTESDAGLDLWMARLEVRYWLMGTGKPKWWLLARLDYQNVKQDIIGFSGWQDLDMDGNPVEVSGTGKVIDYEVTYVTPQLGVGGRFDLGRSMALGLDLAAGVLFSSDRDDHLLRGRVSEGSATGVSLHCSSDLRLVAADALGGVFVWDLTGMIRYYYATGDQTQTWYADEGEIPAGSVESGISYATESLQYGFGTRLGLEF